MINNTMKIKLVVIWILESNDEVPKDTMKTKSQQNTNSNTLYHSQTTTLSKNNSKKQKLNYLKFF